MPIAKPKNLFDLHAEVLIEYPVKIVIGSQDFKAKFWMTRDDTKPSLKILQVESSDKDEGPIDCITACFQQALSFLTKIAGPIPAEYQSDLELSLTGGYNKFSDSGAGYAAIVKHVPLSLPYEVYLTFFLDNTVPEKFSCWLMMTTHFSAADISYMLNKINATGVTTVVPPTAAGGAKH